VRCVGLQFNESATRTTKRTTVPPAKRAESSWPTVDSHASCARIGHAAWMRWRSDWLDDGDRGARLETSVLGMRGHCRPGRTPNGLRALWSTMAGSVPAPTTDSRRSGRDTSGFGDVALPEVPPACRRRTTYHTRRRGHAAARDSENRPR